MYFKYFWREKISKIILGIDSSNFLWQVKYCRLWSISKWKKLMLTHKNQHFFVWKSVKFAYSKPCQQGWWYNTRMSTLMINNKVILSIMILNAFEIFFYYFIALNNLSQKKIYWFYFIFYFASRYGFVIFSTFLSNSQM